MAVADNAAFVGQYFTLDHPEQSRFTGAVASDQGQAVAGVHRKRDPVKKLSAVICF